jgi:hypothetical protein
MKGQNKGEQWRTTGMGRRHRADKWPIGKEVGKWRAKEVAKLDGNKAIGRKEGQEDVGRRRKSRQMPKQVLKSGAEIGGILNGNGKELTKAKRSGPNKPKK